MSSGLISENALFIAEDLLSRNMLQNGGRKRQKYIQIKGTALFNNRSGICGRF